MKYFSMFSGIGGFELGIRQAETKSKDCSDSESGTSQLSGRSLCIGYSEIDKYAISIYERHFKGHKNYGDATKIRTADLPDFDFLCGGFPCQAFSVAGKRRGFDDTRGTMFFEIARILTDKRPKHFLLENVKGLLSHDNGKTFQTIIGILTELGYCVEWQVLNSKNFGVPQNRERVFIVGHLGIERSRKVFPIGTQPQNNSEQTKKLSMQTSNTLRSNYSNGFANETYTTQGARIRRLTPTECERLQGFPDGWTEGLSDTQRYKCLGNAVTVSVIEAIMQRLNPVDR